MTDQELKIQFVAVQGKLFAIMSALSMLINDRYKGGDQEALEVILRIANKFSTDMMNNQEPPDSADKN